MIVRTVVKDSRSLVTFTRPSPSMLEGFDVGTSNHLRVFLTINTRFVTNVVSIRQVSRHVVHHFLPSRMVTVHGRVAIQMVVFVVGGTVLSRDVHVRLGTVLRRLGKYPIVRLTCPRMDNHPHLRSIILNSFGGALFFKAASYTVQNSTIFNDQRADLRGFVRKS